MQNLSQSQLITIWCELEDAYYGQNDFGGDTAELYAYHFMSADPGAMNYLYSEKKNSFMKKAFEESSSQAAKSLYSVLKFFMQKRDCNITVNRQKFGKWILKDLLDHRVHVKIIRKKQ